MDVTSQQQSENKQVLQSLARPKEAWRAAVTEKQKGRREAGLSVAKSKSGREDQYFATTGPPQLKW